MKFKVIRTVDGGTCVVRADDHNLTLQALASDFKLGQSDCKVGTYRPNMSKDYYDGYAQQYAADECAANGYPQ